DPENYAAVAVEIKVFYCPSNRTGGSIDLPPYVQQWGAAMPPSVGAINYARCKGASASFGTDPGKIPPAVRGLFNITAAGEDTGSPRFRVPLARIRHGPADTPAHRARAGG